MDRLRHLISAVLSVALLGCPEKKAELPPPSRFDSVETTERAAKAQDAFCEKVFPPKGETSRRWSSPPSRPLPKPRGASPEAGSGPGRMYGGAQDVRLEPAGLKAGAASGTASWTWINLWASWCGPCLQEMPLLERWRSSLEKDGMNVRFELWSVDAEEKDILPALDRAFPGEVRWLRSDEDVPAFLESLGLEKNTAIPIHALVDPAGMLRCVRVGRVNEDAYGSIKSILAGG